jgi:cysteine synthase A
MLNPGGSMKDRPARYIIEQGIAEGSLRPGMCLVESTSGNLGIGLAIVARQYGMSFTAVIDPCATQANVSLLRSVGATVEVVTELDHAGGYLHTRVRRARELALSGPDTVWVNQYANERNWRAYYHTAGQEIVDSVSGRIDHLVCAVSTTGSIQGLARRLREVHPRLRVTAVDAVGSVIFGGRPGRRRLPGFGASRVPELLRTEEFDQVIHVNDVDSTMAARHLARSEGILAGGSSGAVIAALGRLLPSLSPGQRVVTVLPDRGERYLDTVYDDQWLISVEDQHAREPAPLASATSVSR